MRTYIHTQATFLCAGNLQTSTLASEMPVSFYSAILDQPAVTLLKGSVYEKRKAEEQSRPEGQAHVHHCAIQLAV